ncbi:O-linked N-acetylglucosamine transferase OGT [Ceraceosorus bombacis]|uniref:O-linked N-acetylglucosamine transferase OGT n=1 Tax=Ceraceosorus bombacis TaxID=401625 RepID=A0A0P1BJG0_9BASI|nr:O-linked N-acetylglucosamine transferase OGT [Ceraceosorus bombacis]
MTSLRASSSVRSVLTSIGNRPSQVKLNNSSSILAPHRHLSLASSSLTPSHRSHSSPAARCACSAQSGAQVSGLRTRGDGGERTYATGTTPNWSVDDPSEMESQKFLQAGTTALEAGDMESAKKAYEQSLAVKENASAHFNLGVCRYHARDLEGAVASWEAVLKLAPQSPDAHTNIASCYVLSKPARPDLALDHLKKASALAPEDAEIHYNMAAVLEAVENLEECLVAYQRALAGGINRAEQNIRNVQAKILGAKAANEANADKVAKPE